MESQYISPYYNLSNIYISFLSNALHFSPSLTLVTAPILGRGREGHCLFSLLLSLILSLALFSCLPLVF